MAGFSQPGSVDIGKNSPDRKGSCRRIESRVITREAMQGPEEAGSPTKVKACRS